MQAAAFLLTFVQNNIIMAKASGRNPIKYNEIFDLNDGSVIAKIIKDIQLVDKEYSKMAKSIETQAKAASDSFKRSAQEIIDSSAKLNLQRQKDRDALAELARATDDLKQRQTNQRRNEEEGGKAKKYAQDSIKGLKTEMQLLIREYEKLSKSEAAEAARMKEIADRVKQLKAAQKALMDEMKLVKKVADAAAGSYNALDQETKKLTADLKKMPGAFDATNKEAQKLIKQINDNNTKLKEFDRNLNIHTRNVGNYKDALGGGVGGLKQFALALAATYLGFQSFNQFAQKVVDANVQISDSLADVRRTASLTAVEGDKLVESLKQLDTRTTLKGLVDLATIGGQLGVPKAELVGFVSAIDQLTVSLKGEISGGAEEMAKGLGKINAVFKVASTEGVDTEQAMLKTGSAILKLGQAGLATGDYLSDFGQRVGGIAANAGIGLPKVLAYGAVLEELGISAEVSGTAMGQLINVMAKSPKEFFKVAQLGDATLKLKDFTDLINNDTEKALDLLFKGLKTGGADLTTFSTMVGSLGLRGTRTVSVMSALAKNTELIELRTKQATKAYQDGTLATEQFQIKNTNLAAALEKLSNLMVNTFVDSSFAQGLADLIGKMIDGKSAGDRLTDEYVKQKAAMDEIDEALPPLIAEYDRLTKKATELGGENKLTTEEQEALNATMNEIGKILPGAIAEMDRYGNVVSIARDKVEGLTDAMRENLQVANRDAAKQLREEIALREANINKMREEVKEGKVYSTSGGGFGGATSSRSVRDMTPEERSKNQQNISQEILKEANAIKKLKDVLLQELSPAEQEVYDKFFNSQKKAANAADAAARKAAEEALARKAAAEAAAKAGVDLDAFGEKAKRVKTEFEKLEDQVKKLENTVRSQAIHGKVDKDTLDALAAATTKLRDAQRAGDMAIMQALEPYKALQTEVSQLNEQLENETAAGKDTTKTIAALTTANNRLRLVTDEVKLAIAGTVSEQERLNTELDITRKELEKQSATGTINNATLNQYNQLVLKIRANNEALQLSILQVTDPMAAMQLQADQLKRTLIEQALAGNLSATELAKYKEILVKIAEANKLISAATMFNPLDPAGRISGADFALELNQREINKVSPRAEGGKRDALKEQQRLEQDRLQLTLNRLQAEQDTLRKGSKEWEAIETEKTRVIADQERMRTAITQEQMNYRTELLTQGLGLMSQALDGYFEFQKMKNDAQLAQLQSDKEKELELAGNNTAAKEAIEAKYAQKQREIKRKQAQQEKNQALFQIAIETAIGSAKAIASSPLTFGMPWLAFVIAQGVLQAALVAARPIPQFYKGTLNAPEGVAWLGERGQEAVVSRDGSARLTGTSAHLGYLDAGDKVYTAGSPETKKYQALLTERPADTGRMYVNASGDIIQARAEYDQRITAQAIAGLGKTLGEVQDAAGSSNARMIKEIRQGNQLVAQTIKQNRPIITPPVPWSFQVKEKQEYVIKNLFS